MIDGTFKYFIELHKENLKELFYPIKLFLMKCENQNKNLYSFLPKHNILVKYTNQIARINNFKNEFDFIIYHHTDIKKVKLYYTKNQYKEFWTCGIVFTKFYFKNYLNNRICIKSGSSYESINLDNDDNLKRDEYYLLSNKEFDFNKIIKSFVDLNWDNPPDELNYIIKKGMYNKKYRMQQIDFENENLKTFFHNSKIGITISILTNLITYYNINWRVLYFDCNYIFNSNTKNKKNYYLYFLNLLFSNNESNEANEFIMNIYNNFAKYDNDFETLINEIIKKFNNNKKIIIIFDNIRSKYHYSLIEHVRDNINIAEKNHIFIREFIEINENTLEIIKSFFESERAVKIVGKYENINLKSDLKIIIGLMECKQNFFLNYKTTINDKLSEIFKDYSISKYVNLIKLFYYLYTKDISKDISKEIILSNILKDFIEFLFIKISDGLVEIKFRNRIIENYFQNYYIYYHNIFCSEQSKTFLKEILESEKAYNFERQIIFSIILGNLTNIYHRINIDRIYCVGKFPKFTLENNLLFYQNNSNSPLYDFGVLIKDEEGKLILKIFQVFINKSVEDIKKLISEKIQFDLSYFIEKLNRIFNIEIEKFTFGIIYSKKRYDKCKENNNIKFMKNYFLKNKYEFLLYDLDNNIFYIDKSQNNDKDSFVQIKSLVEKSSYYFKPIKIFRDNYKICKKFYIERIKESQYSKALEHIYEYFDGEINLKLVGKFYGDISVFEQNKNKNIVYFCRTKKNKNIGIYFQNFLLYNKNKNTDNYCLKEEKKEILVFMNANSSPLKIKNNSHLKANNFVDIKKEFREFDTNYLISDTDEDLNLYSEEENDGDNDEQLNDAIKEISIEDLIDKKIDKKNFQSKVIEYQIKENSNKTNDLIEKEQNNNKEQINSSKEKSDENNSDSFKVQNEGSEKSDYLSSKEQSESDDNTIDLESIELKAYPINQELYKELLKGNEKILKSLKEKIIDESDIGDSPENCSFLSKKRNKSLPKDIK